MAACESGHRLHRGAGDVGVARRAGRVAPAAVGVLGLAQPGQRLLEAADARGAQGDDREGGAPGPALVGAVVAAAVEQRRDQVAAAEGARVEAGAFEGEDRAREVAAAAQVAGVRAQVVDRRPAPLRDVERVAARRLQPEHRPGGGGRARGLVGGVAEAAVAVLDRGQPARRLAGARRAGAGRQRRRQRQGEQQGGRQRRRAIARAPLEALAEAGEHADHRRPRDEGEGDVADRVGGVEGDRSRLQQQEVLERKVTAICCHQREIEQGAVGDACKSAYGGERQPADVAAAERGERRAQQPAHPPPRHLPRGPRPLAEPEVGDQRGQRADREAGGAAQRVAGEDDDVGGRLDVGEGGEGDAAGDRQRRQGGDQGDDLRGRARALVPGEAGEQDGGEDQEAGQLPAHRSPSSCERGRPRLGGDHARQVEHPGDFGREVPAAGEDLARRGRRRSRRRRRAGRPARRRRRRTRRRGWRRRPRRRRGPCSSISSTSSPLRARSMPRVGSSSATSPGSASPSIRPARAIASASRCRSPPERSRGSRSTACSSPTARSAAAPCSPGQLVADPLADQVVAGVLGQQRHPAGHLDPVP